MGRGCALISSGALRSLAKRSAIPTPKGDASQEVWLELFQTYLPTHSIGFKIMEKTHPNLITVRIEWEHDFEYVVNPTDPEILKYFSGKWKMEEAEAYFPKRTLWQEFKESSVAFSEIAQSVFRSKVLKK